MVVSGFCLQALDDKSSKRFANKKRLIILQSSNKTSGTFSHVPQAVFLASLSPVPSLLMTVCVLELACRLDTKFRIHSPKSLDLIVSNSHDAQHPPLILSYFSRGPSRPPHQLFFLTVPPTRTPKCASTSRPSGLCRRPTPREERQTAPPPPPPPRSPPPPPQRRHRPGAWRASPVSRTARTVSSQETAKA